MDKPTSEGERLIREWLIAREELERSREVMYRRQADLSNAEKALVAWMLPPAINAKPGEKIAIWAGDSLIEVEVGGVISCDGQVCHQSSTSITIRFRGKDFHKLR